MKLLKKIDFKAIGISLLKNTLSILKKMQPILIAVVVGLIAGIIMMLIFEPSRAFWGLGRLLAGGFSFGIKGFGNTLNSATPIILTGLAVVFAFKTGLFNIGASGQMMIAAFVTVYIGVLWTIPAPLHWMVAILLGTLAGGLWGLIPGLLKALRNVNEVIASIMLNYIAANLLYFLVDRFVLNPNTLGGSSNIQTTAEIPPLLDGLFNNSSLTIGFIFAIIAAIIAHIIIYKTTLGFQLRASGFSIEGSKYAGMNTKRNIILSMLISGLFAGLAGAVLFSVIGKTIPKTTEIFAEGFDGISVALLGLGEPIGAIFSGLFISHLKQGGIYMQPYFKPEISSMIIAVVIYVTAISATLQIVLRRYKENIKAYFVRKKEKRNGGKV